MAEYYNVTTNLGDAEIANAIATNTKLNITHIAFGDGNGSVPTPAKTRTSLVREVHRQAVTKYERHATNANWIVIETIIPSSVGGFTIREMGIIANGKLISHGSHAPFEKVADPSGVSEYRLRFTQNVTDGSVVELTLDESLIYATQAWIDENYIKRSEIADNLTTNDADKVASARTVKELQDNKLDITDGTATRLSASQLNLGDSKIEVVAGSNYTITYNYSNRIAHIRMKILSNQSVFSNSVFVNQQSNSTAHFKALITLPITLQSRLSQSFELVSTNSGALYSDEAAEWLRFFDPINTNNSSESKVGINLIRWFGTSDEAIDAYLEVTGVF